MTIFFVFLALCITGGFCWMADRENFAIHAAALLLLELCNIAWLVLPRV